MEMRAKKEMLHLMLRRLKVTDPADSTSSRHECESKEGNVDTGGTVWLNMLKFTLLLSDKQTLATTRLPLTDKHINLSQAMLKKQFPLISGLQLTLLQSKKLSRRFKSGIQIIFCCSNHWITVYKSECDIALDVITVYDSVYSSVDEDTRSTITNLFDVSEEFMVVMGLSQKQKKGTNNCSLFAIAAATALAMTLLNWYLWKLKCEIIF